MAELARVFSDLVRFETRLYNTLNDRLRAEHGVPAGQYEFLRRIALGERCRVNDLAHEFAITTGAASKGVDRLEAAGWVRRTPHPQNRRSSVLALTEAGRTVLDAATRTFDEVLAAHLGEPLTVDGLTDLGRALGVLRGAIQDADLGAPWG